MPFTFRHFKQILETWVSYVVGHSTISDVNPGSIIRTIGEATAIELAQVYVQMKTLLNLFSIDKATGEDLDTRAADWGLVRNTPEKSSGVVTFGDSSVAAAVISTTAAVLTGGVSTQIQVQVADYAALPASGSVVVERDGANRELVAYTSKTGPDLLNLSGTIANNHNIGVLVHLSTAGTDRTIVSGTVLKTNASPVVKYETTADAVLYDGDNEVTNVPVLSQETGTATILSAGKLNTFESPPFPTATVTNDDRLAGGKDLESDSDFRARIKDYWQTLSSATKLVIESAALKISIQSTGQRVITAKLIEPVAPGECVLYINDGTASFSPTQIDIDYTEFLLPVAEATQKRAGLRNWPIVSGTERIYVSLERGLSTSTGVSTITDTGKTWTTNEWAGFKVKDENNVIFSVVSNTATALTLTEATPTPQVGAYALFDPSNTVFGSGGSLLVKDTDYVINDTNGQLELLVASFPTGLQARDVLLAYYNGSLSAYTHYAGLLQEVQKVITGDPNDLTNYPGVQAAGIIVRITAPTVVGITVNVTLSAAFGVDETTIRDDVRSSILDYINSRAIGEDVLVSRITEAALAIEGVYDAIVGIPTSNVVITDSQLAKTTLGDITVV